MPPPFPSELTLFTEVSKYLNETYDFNHCEPCTAYYYFNYCAQEAAAVLLKPLLGPLLSKYNFIKHNQDY